MRRLFIVLGAAAALLCLAMYFLPHFTRVEKAVAPKANFITLKTHYCMVQLPGENSPTFHERFTQYAAGLMANFESVTIEFYFNEDGQEEAIVIAEKKIWK